MTVGMGASLGTLWRMRVRPETDLKRFFIKALISLTVGLIAGGGIVEYWNLSGFRAAGAGSVAAFLAEEVLMFMQNRGEKLKQGKIDTSLSGGNDE